MNLRAKFITKLALFLLTSSLLLLAIILIPKKLSWPTNSEEVLGEEETSGFQREIEYQEISPDGSNLILLYKMPFHPGMYGHYSDYLSGQLLIAVKEIASGRERYILVTEHRSGDPHWLDNNYVYFTVYCGTACRGIQLAGIGGRKSELAVLSYIYDNEAERYETHFKDWFDNKFVFEGLIDEVKSEMIDDKAYLIFRMKDGQGNFLYEKRFLFTGSSLEMLD